MLDITNYWIEKVMELYMKGTKYILDTKMYGVFVFHEMLSLCCLYFKNSYF